MTLTTIASCLAVGTLTIPAWISARWLVSPPHGRTRYGPAMVLVTTTLGVLSQLLNLTGLPVGASFVRLIGTVMFALVALEVLNRKPRIT